MSWLYSAALVVAYSADSCSDGEPSARSKSTPMPQAYCAPDRMTDFSRPSRFGMTFAPLTADHGAALLTSYLAAFRVKISASPERAPASTVSAPDSGQKWPASFVRFDRATCSWKTAQRSFLADLEQFSATWPRWGSMRNGACIALPMPARPTFGSESGFLLPTLTTGGGGQPLPPGTTPTGMTPDGKKRTVSLRQALCMLPTLTVHGNYNRKGASPNSGDGLATVLKSLPTLRSRDWKDSGTVPPSRQADMGKDTLGQRLARDGNGGPLNPTWCEWFMMFPLGWTALDASEMHKFQHKQPWPGGCCTRGSGADVARTIETAPLPDGPEAGHG